MRIDNERCCCCRRFGASQPPFISHRKPCNVRKTHAYTLSTYLYVCVSAGGSVNWPRWPATFVRHPTIPVSVSFVHVSRVTYRHHVVHSGTSPATAAPLQIVLRFCRSPFRIRVVGRCRRGGGVGVVTLVWGPAAPAARLLCNSAKSPDRPHRHTTTITTPPSPHRNAYGSAGGFIWGCGQGGIVGLLVGTVRIIRAAVVC